MTRFSKVCLVVFAATAVLVFWISPAHTVQKVEVKAQRGVRTVEIDDFPLGVSPADSDYRNSKGERIPGAKISSVEEDGRAEEAGLKKGDVIYDISEKDGTKHPITNAADLRKWLNPTNSAYPIMIGVYEKCRCDCGKLHAMCGPACKWTRKGKNVPVCKDEKEFKKQKKEE